MSNIDVVRLTSPLPTLLLAGALAGCASEYGAPYGAPPQFPRPPDSMMLLVRRTDPIASQELKDRLAGQHLNGDYQIKTGPNGRVTVVRVVHSIPDCDAMVIDYLQHWVVSSPPPIMHVEVVFALPMPEGSPSRYRALPEMSFEPLVAERVAPPPQRGFSGRGSYMVYVEPDGVVSRVEVVESTGNADAVATATIMRWKFRPVGERVRGVLHLAVDLNSPRPERAVASSAAPANVGAPLAGPLSKADIVAGMSGVKLRVQLCFERYRVPGIWSAAVTIINSGYIGNVHVTGPDAETANCVSSAVAGAVFRPFSGPPMSIVYPYALR